MTAITEFETELARLKSGDHQPIESSTESKWNENWMSNDVSAHEPLVIALLGGAMADRLAWVFHAGYQGMMRYAFPFCPQQGWASYLVAEDKTGEYPGTVLTKSDDQNKLSGYKSWVAASDHVDHLVVQVTGSEENTLLLIDRNEAGVSLSSRESPGFLADLSQGFAAFESVSVAAERVFSSADQPPNFAQSEPHHVLTALNAFMTSQALKLGGDPDFLNKAISSLHLAGKLVEDNTVDDDFFLGIADLDAATTETARSFEQFLEDNDTSLHLRWQRDRGLVKMFSRGLQKRASWIRDK